MITRRTLFALIPAAVLLASCMSSEQRLAAQNAQDDRQCLAYGSRQGSDAYVACRSRIASARTTADAIDNSAATTAMAIESANVPQTPPSVVICSPTARVCY